MKHIFCAALIAFAFQAQAEQLPKANAKFAAPKMPLVEMGQLLFFDPILSGNKTVSCATCHHPKFATSDGLSLGVGDGGIGLGPARRIDVRNPPEQRIPRNAPALFNLGAAEFSVMFHDGRLEADATEPNGIRTPLGGDMTLGFDSVLSAQTMFPVLSPDEMAGHYSENDVAQAVRQGVLTGPNGAWDILTNRVADLPEYQSGFANIIGPERPIHFTDISNAIAAFMSFEWRADNSLFDRYLKGDAVLNADQTAGLNLFYGDAGCATCHAGQFQTDHQFHAIGIPQIGPGKAARFERHKQDLGRMRVTGAVKDAYAFRTPSLRNVAHTAPYGHSGAYSTLKSIISHHADPVSSLQGYDPSQAILPQLGSADDFAAHNDRSEQTAIANAITLQAKPLTQQDIDYLIAFLQILTDKTALNGRLGVPASVPSGIPVEN